MWSSASSGAIWRTCLCCAGASRPPWQLRTGDARLEASTSAGAELLGYLEEAVVGLGLADGDPDPVVAVLADHQPRLVARRREVGRVRAEREPEEVGLARRQLPTLVLQRGRHPGALLDQGIDALLELCRVPQRRDRGGLGDRVDPERDRRLAQRRRDPVVRYRIPDPQPREPVSLRKGPQHNEVRVLTPQLDRVWRLRVGDELDVGLVEHDQDARRDPVEEEPQLALTYRRPW